VVVISELLILKNIKTFFVTIIERIVRPIRKNSANIESTSTWRLIEKFENIGSFPKISDCFKPRKFDVEIATIMPINPTPRRSKTDKDI
jgi:hypothetical protein